MILPLLHNGKEQRQYMDHVTNTSTERALTQTIKVLTGILDDVWSILTPHADIGDYSKLAGAARDAVTSLDAARKEAGRGRSRVNEPNS